MIGKNLAFFFFIFSLTCCLNIQPSGNNSSSSGNSSDSGKPSDSPSDSGGSSSGSQKEPDWVLTKVTTEYNLSTNLTVNIDGENIEYNKYISGITYDYEYYNDSLNYFYNTKTVNKYYLNNSYIGAVVQSESKIDYTSNNNLKTSQQKTYIKNKETGTFYVSLKRSFSYLYYPELIKYNKLISYNKNNDVLGEVEYFYDVLDLNVEDNLHKYRFLPIKQINNGAEELYDNPAVFYYYDNDKVIKTISSSSIAYDGFIYETEKLVDYKYGINNSFLGTTTSTKIYRMQNNQKTLQSSTIMSVEDIELVKETNNELVYSFNYYQTDTNGVKTLTYKETRTFTRL